MWKYESSVLNKKMSWSLRSSERKWNLWRNIYSCSDFMNKPKWKMASIKHFLLLFQTFGWNKNHFLSFKTQRWNLKPANRYLGKGLHSPGIAMPAWSEPGTHRVIFPGILWYLVMVSSTLLVRACPRWSSPVTLGGGMTIMKTPSGGTSLTPFLPYSGLKKPLFSYQEYQAASTY